MGGARFEPALRDAPGCQACRPAQEYPVSKSGDAKERFARWIGVQDTKLRGVCVERHEPSALSGDVESAMHDLKSPSHLSTEAAAPSAMHTLLRRPVGRGQVFCCQRTIAIGVATLESL